MFWKNWFKKNNDNSPIDLKTKRKYDDINDESYKALSDEQKDKIERYRNNWGMTPVEYMRYNRFTDDHKICRSKHHSTIGGLGPIVSFVGTGLGYIISCECPICGEKVDVTDIDNW